MSKNKKNSNKYLIITAASAAALAGCLLLYKNFIASAPSSEATPVQEPPVLQAEADNDKIEIPTENLSENVSFIDYNYNGTDMQLMLLKTSDGKIRCALNTCQVCNGSPYAYFVQEGNAVICQNCGNSFALEEIGEARGGCNPIPVEFEQTEDKAVVNTDLLNSLSSVFTNWKKGVS